MSIWTNYARLSTINKYQQNIFICGFGGAHFFRTQKDRKQIRSCKASQDWKRGIHSGLTLQGLNLSHQIFLERCWIWGVGRESHNVLQLFSTNSNYSLLGAGGSAAGCRWKVWAMALRDDFWRRCAFGTELHVESVRNCWKPPTFRCSEEGSCSSAPAHNKTDGRVQHYQQSILDSSLVA